MLSNKSKVLSGFILAALIFVLTQTPTASAKSSDSFSITGATLSAFGNALAFFDSRKGDIKDDSDKLALQACVTAPSGLVSWYRAENNGNDSQGTNHGMLQNGTTFAAGQVGQAFNFTILNQRVEIPDSASLDITTAVTLEAWVAPTQFGEADNGTTFISKSDLTTLNNQPYGLLFASNGRVLMRVGNSANLEQSGFSSTVLPLNSFSHVVGTYDGATIKIYVNGVLENSQAASIGAMTTNNLPVRIGANNVNGYLGKIDEPSIYNRALTDAEIQAIFNAGSAGKCLAPPAVCTAAPANQVSWYRAENNANDSQGSNHGTLQNGTTFTAGKVGQAFSFDGIDDVVSITDNPTLNPSGSLTIEAWVNPNASSTGSNAMISKWNDLGGNTNTAYALTLENPNTLRFAVAGSNGGFADIQSSVPVPLNTWTHVAGIFNAQAQTLCVFVNGVKTCLLGTTNFNSLRVSTAPLLIGAGDFGGGARRFFNGQIDEASIYNRALSDTEIQAIFNADSAGKCLAPTSASVTVGGRVITASGRGINRAALTLTDANGAIRFAQTNSFGYYRFADVPTGETYVIGIRHKYYEFKEPSRLISVNEENESVNFTAYE
ncbi:MAG TPA: LamG-like jellyroll fold domain-containing protein [Pyrinomonadaceae bacterium]|nr:LamG-like jellyroll fold domain-containing protein [Pyrinomonadaceae bacterium]